MKGIFFPKLKPSLYVDYWWVDIVTLLSLPRLLVGWYSYITEPKALEGQAIRFNVLRIYLM